MAGNLHKFACATHGWQSAQGTAAILGKAPAHAPGCVNIRAR